MKKLSVAIILLLLVAGVQAQERGPMEWHALNFTSIEGTPNAMHIDMVMDALATSKKSQYRENYEAGKVWSCIIEVLDGLAGMERAGTEEDFAKDATGRNWEFFRYHAEFKWGFWLGLARVGQAAQEFGDRTVLNPDVIRLLEEMEVAFEPFLEPHQAPPEIPKRPKLRG